MDVSAKSGSGGDHCVRCQELHLVAETFEEERILAAIFLATKSRLKMSIKCADDTNLMTFRFESKIEGK